MKKYPIPNYTDRKSRNEYLINLIDSSFQETKTILNIGGGQKRYLKNSKYNVTEIDKEGDNDLNLDLDNIKKLPFEDNSFDTVVGLDVLEHLENFHLVSSEMLRVSKKNVIISLPNCFHTFFTILLNKKTSDPNNNGVYNKFYGLPIKKPADRHRWFFTNEDVERFFNNFSKENNIKVEYILPKSKSLKSKIISIFLSKRLRKIIFSKYFWIILKKS